MPGSRCIIIVYLGGIATAWLKAYDGVSGLSPFPLIFSVWKGAAACFMQDPLLGCRCSLKIEGKDIHLHRQGWWSSFRQGNICSSPFWFCMKSSWEKMWCVQGAQWSVGACSALRDLRDHGTLDISFFMVHSETLFWWFIKCPKIQLCKQSIWALMIMWMMWFEPPEESY